MITISKQLAISAITEMFRASELSGTRRLKRHEDGNVTFFINTNDIPRSEIIAMLGEYFRDKEVEGHHVGVYISELSDWVEIHLVRHY